LGNFRFTYHRGYSALSALFTNKSHQLYCAVTTSTDPAFNYSSFGYTHSAQMVSHIVQIEARKLVEGYWACLSWGMSIHIPKWSITPSICVGLFPGWDWSLALKHRQEKTVWQLFATKRVLSGGGDFRCLKAGVAHRKTERIVLLAKLMTDHLALRVSYKLRKFSVRPILIIAWPLRFGFRWEMTTGKTLIPR
jgi:hypothetical protein